MTTTRSEPGSRILSIGECMAELAPTEIPGEYRLGFAGDTFNTAWYLARLRPDATVSYCTAVGTDTLSSQMRAAFGEAGIDDSHVYALPDRTVGLYLISLDRGERSFSYWRGQSAARHLADDPEALVRAMDAADLVYFSGITLAILSPAARQTLLEALRRARAAGKCVAFDPNLRPRLWSEMDEMTDAIMEGARVSDIALPSFEDEARWFSDLDPDATIERYRAAGVGTVIVKNGSEPVHYHRGSESGTIAVPPLTHVVDTTAAGDSFNAAILDGLDGTLPLRETIMRACRLAGQVVQGKGALVSVDPVALTS
ncbi:sugar kinase [Limimaricola pyoseonensis]|uniref:2-keto-3-deoxygluconate kinase n=1 Tax=Limimaricola pyoseonensis TaxID=521013 RepID=A0A1G7LAE2_9RHOB|nr:sugar kinase [Limimaricola pyoseonensis]SDF46423.1 2-keto-3-deoxygluconate kinase [Limimaricola pyoseonensis]